MSAATMAGPIPSFGQQWAHFCVIFSPPQLRSEKQQIAGSAALSRQLTMAMTLGIAPSAHANGPVLGVCASAGTTPRSTRPGLGPTGRCQGPSHLPPGLIRHSLWGPQNSGCMLACTKPGRNRRKTGGWEDTC